MINSENRNGLRMVKGKKKATLAADVSSVIDKARSRRGSAIFDPAKYPQLDEERFNELKKAFLVFDKDASGNIKTSDLPKLLDALSEKFTVQNNVENLTKSADPNNKGTVSFAKFVILVEINKKEEEVEVFDPTDYADRVKVFNKFVQPGTDLLKYSNLFSFFECLGLDPPKDEVDELVEKYAAKYEGKLLEFLDVCNVIDNLKTEEERNAKEINLPEHWLEEINDVFSVFDKDSNGWIDKDEMPLAMRCLRIKTTPEEIQHLIPFEDEGIIKLPMFLHIMEKKIKSMKQEELAATSKLTEEEVNELREAFALFDVDGDGTITTAELGNVMKSLGRKLTTRQLKEIVRTADLDNSGTIEFTELLAIMEENSVRCSYLDEMRKAFGHFDKDGNGFISPTELRQAMERMKIRMGKVEFLLMLKRVDTDKDGQVNFKEFVTMMASDQNI